MFYYCSDWLLLNKKTIPLYFEADYFVQQSDSERTNQFDIFYLEFMLKIVPV